jgi:hypothetical protein
MRALSLFSLTLTFLVATLANADEPKADAKSNNKLVGTWKLMSAVYGGRESTLTKTATTLKHITPTHYMWLSHDSNGIVTRGAGGSFTLKGDEFVQQGQYGVGAEFTLVKGQNAFKCKVDGNKWHHAGKLANGLIIEEVWERQEK